MPIITFIRGLPGSGKSTHATRLRFTDRIIEADNFLVDDKGEYRYTPDRCALAHGLAKDTLRAATDARLNVVVSNTFSQRWELDDYFRVVNTCGYTVAILDLFDAGLTDAELAARCIHSVPVEKIALMRSRWERW